MVVQNGLKRRLPMKKMIMFVISVALLLTLSMPFPVSAQQIIIEECGNHDDYCAEVVKEVPVTFDMLLQAQKMNVVPMNASLVVPYATCNHTYTAWKTIATKTEPSTEFGKCHIRTLFQIRYCTKCNASFAREKTVQEHNWVSSNNNFRCTICGLTGGTAR